MIHTCSAGFQHSGTPSQVRRWESRSALAQGMPQAVVDKARAHDDYLDAMETWRKRMGVRLAALAAEVPARERNLWQRIGIEDAMRALDEALTDAWRANQEDRDGQA